MMLKSVQKIPKVHVRLKKKLLMEYNLSIEMIVSTHFPHLTYVLIYKCFAFLLIFKPFHCRFHLPSCGGR